MVKYRSTRHLKLQRKGGKHAITHHHSEGYWSNSAIELTEGDHAPVMYFPRSDIAMAFLEPSSETTTCRHKGTASLYSIETKSRTIQNAAWSYEGENASIDDIKNHVAFHTSELVTVERL